MPETTASATSLESPGRPAISPTYSHSDLDEARRQQRENERLEQIRSAWSLWTSPTAAAAKVSSTLRDSRYSEAVMRTGVPQRYANANILEPGSDDPAYLDAVDTLLSCFAPHMPHLSPRDAVAIGSNGEPAALLSTKPYDPGAIFAIVGPRGTGKTHMACGLCHLFLFDHSSCGEPPLYRRAFDIFADIKGTFGGHAEKSQADIIRQLQAAPVLVIDEIQVRSDSQWENDIITNLVDRRYAQCRPTVIISNLDRGALLASLGDSIASRMLEAGAIVEATWPSFRG